jgi:endonuclease-3
VARAEPGAVAAAIAPGGLGPQKAPRIQALLRRLEEERGNFVLDFLADRPPGEAFAYLTNLAGVGPKTAACVLLFAFGMPFFPADSHILRVGGRLGLLPGRDTAAAQKILAGSFPPAEILSLHLYLIEHGRAVCRPKPRCDECFLVKYCPHAAGATEGGVFSPSPQENPSPPPG